MSNKIIYRIILDIIIFISVIHGWWFTALPLSIIGLWVFELYIEILFVGILYDSLFGFIAGMGIRSYLGTICGVVILGLVLFLKRIVRR